MPDLDEQLSSAFEDFTARHGGFTEIPPRTLRALSRRGRRPRLGPTAAVAATVTVVLLVVGAVTFVGSRTGRSPHGATTSATKPSLPPILEPGQFLGLIYPGDQHRTEQYVWVLGADGRPIKRLTRAIGVLGVTSDRRQALIEPSLSGTGGVSTLTCDRSIADPATAVLSLADGSLTSPFPDRPGVKATALGGQLVAGLGYPQPSDRQGCTPPSLLVRDLVTGATNEYPLTSSPGFQPKVVAVSPDERWAVIDNLEHPDHQVFYRASLGAGTAQLTRLPSQPGCTQSAISAYPGTNDLTVTAACGRTITITTYDPDTLAVTRTEHIADPPGATVTFAGLSWNTDGSQALIEAIQDNTTHGGRGIYVWRNGTLTRIRTSAYGVKW